MLGSFGAGEWLLFLLGLFLEGIKGHEGGLHLNSIMLVDCQPDYNNQFQKEFQTPELFWPEASKSPHHILD